MKTHNSDNNKDSDNDNDNIHTDAHTSVNANINMKSHFVPFILSKEIQDMVARLAEKIESHYGDKELICICPLQGSFCFFSDLIRCFSKLTLKIDFVCIKTLWKGGPIYIHKGVHLDIRNRHVLIVEEIIDTGKTLNFLKKHLLGFYPASLKIVTLLDKPARREILLKPDYYGRVVEDRYLIGYGMDIDGYGRNYSDIYQLKN